MTPVQVLATFGLVGCTLTMWGGLFSITPLIGIGGAFMLFGNVYAMIWGRR